MESQLRKFGKRFTSTEQDQDQGFTRWVAAEETGHHDNLRELFKDAGEHETWNGVVKNLLSLLPSQAADAFDHAVLNGVDIGPENSFFVLDLAYRGSWTLIPGVLTASNLRLILNVAGPKGARHFEGKLIAATTFGGERGIEIDLYLDLPALTLFAFLVPGADSHLHGAASLLQLDALGLDSLVPGGMLLYADPRRKRIAFQLDLDGHWKAGPVSATALHIDLDYTGGRDSRFAANLVAAASFGGLLLELSAAYEGKGAGWTFSGELATESPLPIGKIAQDALGSFGAGLPDFVAGFTVSAVGVTFNTTSGHFGLCLETSFNDGRAGAPRLLLDASVTKAGAASDRTFAGRFIVPFGGSVHSFGVSYHADCFVARYDSTGGDGLDLRSLAALIDDDLASALPAALNITLTSATLAYEKSSKAWAASVEIGAVDLSTLKGIPLIGNAFSAAGAMKLTLQPAFGTRKAQFTGWKEVSHSFPEHPASPPREAVIRAVLDLCGHRIPLAIPAGFKPGSSQVAHQPGAADATAKPVGITLGPLTIDHLDVSFNNGNLRIAVDGSFGLAGLRLVFLGLAAEGKLDQIRSGDFPAFSIDGLGLSMDRGALAISGLFLRTATGFAGRALFRLGNFSLAGIGAFSEVDGHPSLFLYAFLNVPLGGPAFFFIEGLAAGFGVNRRFLPPPVDQIRQFPLIKEVMDGASGGKDEFTLLAAYLRPSIGEYFISAGIKFSSFRLIKSFALVTVAFGNELEFSLLGVSELLAPPQPKGSALPSYVRITMALRAVVKPAEGLIDVAGQLTRESYIYSPLCVPAGGFAFRSWVSGTHQGDFVLTLGGYYPTYRPPAHYPQPATVPRCEFGWVVDSSTYVKGSLYFALTSSCIMAGIGIEASWSSDSMDASAHFRAGLDFLIAWKPFHYEAHAYIAISGHISFLDFDLGADVTIWGPEFGGSAHVHVGVLFVSFDFDVSWGAPYSKPTAIDWKEFSHSFLPQPDKTATFQVAGGLVKRINQVYPVINPVRFQLCLSSLVPITTVTGPLHRQGEYPVTAFGIAPMGAAQAASTAALTLERRGPDGEYKPCTTGLLAYTAAAKPFPTALWGGSLQPDPDAGPVSAAGDLTFLPAMTPSSDEPHEILRQALSFDSSTVHVRCTVGSFPYLAASNLPLVRSQLAALPDASRHFYLDVLSDGYPGVLRALTGAPTFERSITVCLYLMAAATLRPEGLSGALFSSFEKELRGQQPPADYRAVCPATASASAIDTLAALGIRGAALASNHYIEDDWLDDPVEVPGAAILADIQRILDR